MRKRNVRKANTAQTASKPSRQGAAKPQDRSRVEYKAKGLTEQRAEELRQEARDAVDEKLKARLETFKDRTRVTEEELEGMVKECVEEAEQQVLAKLPEFEPWIEDAHNATHWVCPSCGEECPRAEDKHGTAIFEDMELKTTFPAAALPQCPTSRRSGHRRWQGAHPRRGPRPRRTRPQMEKRQGGLPHEPRCKAGQHRSHAQASSKTIGPVWTIRGPDAWDCPLPRPMWNRSSTHSTSASKARASSGVRKMSKPFSGYAPLA